jgi:hypothetical protein
MPVEMVASLEELRLREQNAGVSPLRLFGPSVEMTLLSG